MVMTWGMIYDWVTYRKLWKITMLLMGRNPLFLWPFSIGCHISPVWSWWLMMTGLTDAGKGPMKFDGLPMKHPNLCFSTVKCPIQGNIHCIYHYIYIYVCVSYIPRNPNKFHETSWCSSSQSVFISRFFRAVTCAAGAAARSQLPAADSQGVETARALVWRPTEGDDPSDPSFGGSYGWIMENHIDNYWDIDKMIYDIYIYTY